MRESTLQTTCAVSEVKSEPPVHFTFHWPSRLLSWRLHHSYPRGLVRCAALGGCLDTYEEEGRERRRRRWRRGRVTENLSPFTRPQSVFRASPLSSRAQSLCDPGRAEWGGLLHPEPLPLSPPGLPCLSPAPDVPTSTRTTKPAVDANVSPRFHLRVNAGSGYLPGLIVPVLLNARVH